MVLVERSSARDSSLLLADVILQSDLFEHRLEDGQKFNSRFLEQREPEI